MFESFALDVVLLLFCLLVTFENKVKPRWTTLENFRKKLNSLNVFILPLILFVLFSIGLLVLSDVRNPLYIYLYLSAGFTLIFHAVWVFWKLDKLFRVGIISLAVLLFFLRILLPSVLTHDLFVFFITLWFGPLITSFRMFNKKVFISVSLIWLLYDVIYVWLSTMHQQVTAAAQTADFPLTIHVGTQSLGLADFFWAGLFVSFLRTKKSKIWGISALLISNIVLDIFVHQTNTFQTFPSLVMWVPVGLTVLFLEKKFQIRK